MRTLVHHILKKCGLRVFRRRTLPRGIDLAPDLNRLLGTVPRSRLTLFDVGANVGQTSLRFAREFSGATIYAFEPVKNTFGALMRNTRAHTNIKPFQAAMGTVDGTATMSIEKDSTWNRILSPSQDGSSVAMAETVPMKRIDTICRELSINRIHLLKTDCEGYDLEAIKGAEALLDKNAIDSIYCEVNFLRNGKQADFFALESFLRDFGYYFYGLYECSGWQYDITRYGFSNALFVSRDLASQAAW